MNMFLSVPAKVLCKKHLLGIHGELHKFMHNWQKKYKIDGYLANNCMEPSQYKRRHDEVAKEMIHRGMNHKSSLKQPDFSYLPQWQQNYKINKQANLHSLLKRCDECKERYIKINNLI